MDISSIVVLSVDENLHVRWLQFSCARSWCVVKIINTLKLNSQPRECWKYFVDHKSLSIILFNFESMNSFALAFPRYRKTTPLAGLLNVVIIFLWLRRSDGGKAAAAEEENAGLVKRRESEFSFQEVVKWTLGSRLRLLLFILTKLTFYGNTKRRNFSEEEKKERKVHRFFGEKSMNQMKSMISCRQIMNHLNEQFESCSQLDSWWLREWSTKRYNQQC